MFDMFTSRWKTLKQSGKWFQKRYTCAGLDLKDAFLHIPICDWVKKFLRFKWKGKLFEWQVLPFGLKCSPRILTMIVALIVKFLPRRGISLTTYMEYFLCCD